MKRRNDIDIIEQKRARIAEMRQAFLQDTWAPFHARFKDPVIVFGVSPRDKKRLVSMEYSGRGYSTNTHEKDFIDTKVHLGPIQDLPLPINKSMDPKLYEHLKARLANMAHEPVYDQNHIDLHDKLDRRLQRLSGALWKYRERMLQKVRELEQDEADAFKQDLIPRFVEYHFSQGRRYIYGWSAVAGWKEILSPEESVDVRFFT